jgi:hypothetical protein
MFVFPGNRSLPKCLSNERPTTLRYTKGIERAETVTE